MPHENFGGSGTPFSRQRWTAKRAWCLDSGKAFKFETLAEVEDYLADNKLICLECGQSFAGLANHVRWSHSSMTVVDYKNKYNIPVTMRLCGAATAQKIQQAKLIAWQDADYAERGRRILVAATKLLDRTKKINGRKKGFKQKTQSTASKKVIENIARKRRIECLPLYTKALDLALKENLTITQACKHVGTTISRLHAFMTHSHNVPSDMAAKYKTVLALPHTQAGAKGIKLMPNGKFQARYKGKSLGTFTSLTEAEAAYKNAL